MASPNLKNPTTITGITTSVKLSSASITGILTNNSGSDKVFKINSIFAANSAAVSGNVDISISILRDGIDFYVAKTITVPFGGTQLISTKESYFYLEENVGIRAQASVADKADIIISYEEIS